MATAGGSRFEKFSGRARRVLASAQKESQRFNHNYVGTEHILLGLVGETRGVAVQVLSSLGVDLSKVRSAVEFTVSRGEKPYEGEWGLTPRAKKVVELAVDEARRMNNYNYIGTEHLLIGLVREGEGVAATILESLGVTVDKVRAETHRILSKPEPPVSKAEAEPELISLVTQLVALQEQQERIEQQIEDVEEIQQTLPALEDEREMLRQKIREMIGKLGTLLPKTEQTEPQ